MGFTKLSIYFLYIKTYKTGLVSYINLKLLFFIKIRLLLDICYSISSGFACPFSVARSSPGS